MRRIIVVGAGASGMMAAVSAAQAGGRVDLYEKNDKPGRKIYITGKGRCNLTNACPEDEFLSHVCSNPRFLYSSFQAFTNHDAMDWFVKAGLRIRTERGERVFPMSDHASDVTKTLAEQMRRAGVHMHLNTAVKEILAEPEPGAEKEVFSRQSAPGISAEHGVSDTAPAWKDRNGVKDRPAAQQRRVRGVRLFDGTYVPADAVIVCTGGLSYPSTGSTGDGFRFARETGHSVGSLSPSLVPLNIAEDDPERMQGLSLKNVRLRILDGKKVISDGFGEMLFTHFGVSGPLVLTASAQIQKNLKQHPLIMSIDLKPAITDTQLDARLLREFDGNENKFLKNVLGAVYPATMVPVMMDRAGIASDRIIHDVSKAERHTLVEVTHHYRLTVTGLRGFDEAIITKGGVSVRQLNPGTMESKLVRGLYFAGEVLDVDALTGGFNLQIAWTTGRAAGLAAGKM